MSTFILILVVLFLLMAPTLLRLRVRLGIYPHSRTLFVGLGHTGARTDFTNRTRAYLIAGKEIISRPIKKKAKKEKPELPPEKPKKKVRKTRRHRPLRQFLAVIPDSLTAVSRYTFSLLKSVAVEEFEGEINAGFSQPDLTGAAYGFYEAALAGVPGIVGRFKYIPDWTGASFRGQFRFSVAIPLYRIIYRTLVLLVQLPLRDLVKLAIGKKKGK